MTAKEFLSQAYRIDVRINSKLEQVQSLRSLAGKATATLSDMPRNASSSLHPMEDVIVKILELEDEVNADIQRLVDIKREITETLQRVPVPEHRTLLELRYVCCKTWEEIAAELLYSVRNIHRVHGDALIELEKIIPV
ncbi:hypothetical protein FACS1894196_0100 [Clostridia bacterium]|nr:hypothetical protein FACS1894196_0100 [Clostridia bacterium]